MTSGVLVKQAGKPFVLAAGIPGPRGPQGPSGSGDDDVYAQLRGVESAQDNPGLGR